MSLIYDQQFLATNQMTASIFFPEYKIGVIKDTQHRYVAINKKTATMLGFDNPVDVLNSGISDGKLNCNAIDLAETFVKEDKDAVSADEPLLTLGQFSYANNEMKLLLTEKMAIKNAENDVIGYFSTSLDLTGTRIINLAPLMESIHPENIKKGQFSMVIKQEYPDIKLSIRQTECLYYLIKGCSSAEIAKLTELSKRTVECYIDHIKDKMYCISRQQVIEKAICLGYLQIIPQIIFSKIM
ncbi:helix-turn-helix transcriptional regulator [Legionella shakespearei]|uniref:Transcriptional regulator LuxR n=1 Tax=Legionella shakespearei DSM 23087 TaxID=1122169 RepID=A0A0W0Z1Y0_9GAMM|nr:helix-turn-helix domain-containing protein [Legionella shakespearei]KTD63111.1 transcriptional regulator LuxR [Legionella shakespearei DSM 23087]